VFGRQAAVSYNHMELVVFLLASGADARLGELQAGWLIGWRAGD